MSRRRRTTRQPRTNEIIQRPFGEVRNRLKPVELITEDQIETIHDASLKVLRDIGLKVDSAVARGLLASADADVDQDNHRVRFDPTMVEEMLIGIPSEFTIHARNPDKTVMVGGNSLTFATVCGPSFVSDLDRGRRAGTLEDMRNFVKLSASLNIFHHEGGSGCEPLELPPETRHLDMMLAQTTLCDKGWQPCWMNTALRARDCIEMAKIALQTDDDGLRTRPGILGGG